MTSDFLSGFWSGVVTAGILGLLLGQIRLNLKRMGDAGRPQSVVQTTKKTPRRVVTESAIAFFKVLLLLGVLAGSIYFAARVIVGVGQCEIAFWAALVSVSPPSDWGLRTKKITPLQLGPVTGRTA